MNHQLFFPPSYMVEGSIADNRICQINPNIPDSMSVGDSEIEIQTDAYIVSMGLKNPISVVTKKPSQITSYTLLSRSGLPLSKDMADKSSWISNDSIILDTLTLQERSERCRNVIASWEDKFAFLEEKKDGQNLLRKGLRSPQIGALYATLAHWKVSTSLATIVMPTGTGKTETMLTLFTSQGLDKLLIIVPTAALRQQIAEKFSTLGILREFGIIKTDILLPIVGTMNHRLRTIDDVHQFFASCNVIVATMSVIGGCSDEVQQEIAKQCQYLFIDEAHHVPAKKWNIFRQYVVELSKPIVQFTATPFRRDGKHIGGKIIFNYPLRKAQEEEYFKPIKFVPISEYDLNKADRDIAQTAISQLRDDRANGYDHIIMARADNIKRAEEIAPFYQELASEFNPLLINSKYSDAYKKNVLRQLRNRDCRIVICVDMLGEGFDLPQLKIAALHDVHKSLAITLQFIGRFTRVSSGISNATVIVNVADARVEEALEDLYYNEPDWNVLLPRMSEVVTDKQEKYSEILGGFSQSLKEIPIHNIYPKMSTVVYRTHCASWRPKKIIDVISRESIYAGPAINTQENIALFITCHSEAVSWGASKEIQNKIYDLYLLHWDFDEKLLYINSSDNSSLHTELAKAVAGDDIAIIRGEIIYRALYGINHLILLNLGLIHNFSRAAQFTMHVGSDIKSGLSVQSLENRRTSNTFGKGFRDGEKITMGASYKGRIWSHRVAENVLEWVEWCHHVGAKLTDENISVDDILRHVIVPKIVFERPKLMPLAIEWPEDFLTRPEQNILLDVDGHRVPLYEASIDITSFTEDGPIRFVISTDLRSAEYAVIFKGSTVEYRPTGQEQVKIFFSGKEQNLSNLFVESSPIIRFEDNSFLEYNELYTPNHSRSPFDSDRIEAWDWSGVNIKFESKFKKKDGIITIRNDSIQSRVIDKLIVSTYDYDIIFNDDDKGEIADIVAIKIQKNSLLVHLYHCKYSEEDRPGARVTDLYEVCGQVQKSVFWKSEIMRLVQHLFDREASIQQKYQISRFEKGDLLTLDTIRRQARKLERSFKIFVVQPGVSQNKITVEQMDLLGATELYLQITYAVELGVIVST